MSSAGTTLPNKTLIFHDFQGLTIKFHDFPGLEDEILKLHAFPGFPSPVQTLENMDCTAECNNELKNNTLVNNNIIMLSTQQ